MAAPTGDSPVVGIVTIAIIATITIKNVMRNSAINAFQSMSGAFAYIIETIMAITVFT